MANIKVGDKVQITYGVLSGTFCFVRDILRGRSINRYLFSPSRRSSSSWSRWYADGDFKKVRK